MRHDFPALVADQQEVGGSRVSTQAGDHKEGEITRGLPRGDETVVDAARTCPNCIYSTHCPRPAISRVMGAWRRRSGRGQADVAEHGFVIGDGVRRKRTRCSNDGISGGWVPSRRGVVSDRSGESGCDCGWHQGKQSAHGLAPATPSTPTTTPYLLASLVRYGAPPGGGPRESALYCAGLMFL